MGAGHGHSHGGFTDPADGAPSAGRVRRMALGWVVLLAFLVLEVVVALWIGSLALLADAGHMATDIVGLTLGLVAVVLARRGSSDSGRTFGWHRAEVLAAMGNAILLLGVAAFILYEAIGRIGHDPEIPGLPMIATAAAGLLANIVVMVLLRSHAESSIAVRGAYTEVLADAVSSVGVLIAGIVVWAFGWTWADIVVAVAISLWVLPRALKLAAAALRILTQASPTEVDVAGVRADLAALPGVVSVHDLHIWTLTTGMDVATVHLVSDRQAGVLDRARTVLATHGLEHATVQVESSSAGMHCAERLSW